MTTISEYLSNIGRKGGKASAKKRWANKTEKERKEIMAKVREAREKKKRSE